MFGRRGKKRKAPTAGAHCLQCGGHIVTDDDSGAKVCANCGHISAAASQEVVEVNTQNLVRIRGNVVQRKAPKPTPNPMPTPTAPPMEQPPGAAVSLSLPPAALQPVGESTPFRRFVIPDYSSIMLALEILVKATCEALREKVKLPARDADRVQKVWEKYVAKLRRQGVSIAKSLMDLNYRSSIGHHAPVPSIVAAVVVLALAQSTLPLLPWDVLEMYRNGTLPMGDAVAIFPQALHDRLRKISSMFRKALYPSLDTLKLKTEALARYINLPEAQHMRNLNELVVALRFIVRLKFVPLKDVWPYLLNVYVNRAEGYVVRSELDVAALVIASISCVPQWWEAFVVQPNADAQDPARKCFDGLTARNRLVYAGKVECFSDIRDMHRLYDDEQEFSRYMKYIDKHMVDKVEVPNSMDKHFAHFAKKWKADVNQESTKNSADLVAEKAAEAEKAKKELLEGIKLSRLYEGPAATEAFVKDYDKFRASWGGTVRIDPRSKDTRASYSFTHASNKWLLDLFSTLMRLNTANTMNLHYIIVSAFFHKEPNRNERFCLQQILKVNKQISQRLRATPHLFEHLYEPL